MLDLVFLQCIEGEDRTCKNGPYLFFFEFTILVDPLVDLVTKTPHGVFPDAVNFVDIGTEMVEFLALVL